jgi:VacB/RNase II family 3'-5' exoribonuclease
MPSQRSVLDAIARRAMVEHGLEPDFPPDAVAEAARLGGAPIEAVRDLRRLPWSSIDNSESRDLDQLEVCGESDEGLDRLLVAIADVDALVPRDSALDDHARRNTTSVYTAARVFPMLPESLSTDRTSLNPDEDRSAIVVEMAIDREGVVRQCDIYRAAVRNHAKLAYEAVAAWLDRSGAPPAALAASSELLAQVRLQDRIAQRLRQRRVEKGALGFDRAEARPVIEGDRIKGLREVQANRARDLIEDFMIAANTATAEFLAARHSPSIRRVVRTPDRWPRIVALAAGLGEHLPETPDARALEQFMTRRKAADPDAWPELSLTLVKLLGRGEYVLADPKSGSADHFALALMHYTHSTAPNRRFPDLITQRLIKAAISNGASAYSNEELAVLAQHCTRQEDAASKVERQVQKAAAALWLSDRIGETFSGVVTGASSKGTWARIFKPPVEGKIERGYEGLDVGDRVKVRLIGTNPERGFIDFERM